MTRLLTLLETDAGIALAGLVVFAMMLAGWEWGMTW